MGNIDQCCNSRKKQEELVETSKEMPEELEFEHEICLQEIDKISDPISMNIQKTLNPFFEAVYLLLDFLRNHLSNNVSKNTSLQSIRNLRLNIQRFRENLHEIRHQESLEVHEQKEKAITLIYQLENYTKSSFHGSFVVTFYDCDEKFCGFDKVYEKILKISKENREKGEKFTPNALSKLTTNISCNFWVNSFENAQAKWKDFSTAFQSFSCKTLDYELKENELIMIQSEIDYNNDLMIEVECWDYFYNEIWKNSTKRNNFLSKANELKESLLSSSKSQLELKFQPFISLEENKDNQPFYYYLQEDKIRYSTNQNIPPKEKDFYNSYCLAGKHPNAEISFDRTHKEISTKQFQIHMKKVVLQKNIQITNNNNSIDPFASESGLLTYKPRMETWFILNNMAKKNLVTFLVDEKGFVLTKGMIVNINGNSFKVNEINPSPMLYSDEDVYFVDTRPKGLLKGSYKGNSQDYFIDLEFFKNGPKDIKKFQFIVPKKEDFFNITIGSSKKRGRSDIYIEDEQQNYVARDHCFIVFNPRKNCWIIKDETYNKSRIPFYKTFVFSCGYDEYVHIHNLPKVAKDTKDTDYVARGQKLMDGMRFSFLNNYFEVKIS